MKNDWSLSSWEKYPISQQPKYSNSDELKSVLNELKQQNRGVTTIEEIDNLRDELKLVSENKSMLIIAGDCSEPIEENDEKTINTKCAFLDYLSTLLYLKYRKRVTVIGRIAGQYAKPRSSELENINGGKLF